MPLYLLDTNIVSFLIKRLSPALDHRISLVRESDLLISSITEAELLFGLALLPPEARQHKLVSEFLHAIAIAPWDSRCAEQYGRLAAQQRRAGRPLSTMDILIASHALGHDLTLITKDGAFAMVEGLKTEDWTKGPQAS